MGYFLNRARAFLQNEMTGEQQAPGDSVPGLDYELSERSEISPPLEPKADLVWVSPPCQSYSRFIYQSSKYTTPKLVLPLREVARSLGCHYVIENIADCDELHDPIKLCGYMFGLPLIRHRKFEASFLLPQPTHIKHGSDWVQVAGHGRGSLAQWRQAMGLEDMSKEGLRQAVPFAYTWYVLTWFKAAVFT